jgi:hypothetical protein
MCDPESLVLNFKFKSKISEDYKLIRSAESSDSFTSQSYYFLPLQRLESQSARQRR